MSEQETTTEVTEAGATPNDVAEQQALGEGGKKAISAEREARKAAEESAKALQAQLDEIKAAQMSDLEKAQAQAASFEEAATKATAEALRWRIAAKHGIGDEDAETFLTGSDEATLTRQAERLSSLSTSAPTTPKPDLSQGSQGEPKSQSTADQFADAIESAFTR